MSWEVKKGWDTWGWTGTTGVQSWKRTHSAELDPGQEKQYQGIIGRVRAILLMSVY